LLVGVAVVEQVGCVVRTDEFCPFTNPLKVDVIVGTVPP
jgi:hypothetical protein